MKSLLVLALLCVPFLSKAQDCSKLVGSPMYTASSKTTHTRTLAQNKRGTITSNLYLTRVDRKDRYYYYMWVETFTNYKVDYRSGTSIVLNDGSKYMFIDSHISQDYDSSIGLFRTIVTIDIDTPFLNTLETNSIDSVNIGGRINISVKDEGIEFKDAVKCLVEKGA